MAYYSRKLKAPFQEVLKKLTTNLEQQGFDVVTSIDLTETFRNKLHVAFRNYKILGACHPDFAFKAISLESHTGVMMPCNVVVQEHENSEVEVSAMNPLENMDASLHTTQLQAMAVDVGNCLRCAIDGLHRDIFEKYHEALPTTPAWFLETIAHDE